MKTADSQISKRLPRNEDFRLTTGRGRYLSDIKMIDELHVAFVRSMHAHARITRIETAAARESDGVVGIFIGADIKDHIVPLPIPMVTPNLPGRFPKHWPLAIGKVLYHGDPIVAVVAQSRYLAEDTAELVEVEYEPLPYVGSVESATRPGATSIYDD